MRILIWLIICINNISHVVDKQFCDSPELINLYRVILNWRRLGGLRTGDSSSESEELDPGSCQYLIILIEF